MVKKWSQVMKDVFIRPILCVFRGCVSRKIGAGLVRLSRRGDAVRYEDVGVTMQVFEVIEGEGIAGPMAHVTTAMPSCYGIVFENPGDGRAGLHHYPAYRFNDMYVTFTLRSMIGDMSPTRGHIEEMCDPLNSVERSSPAARIVAQPK